MNPYFDPEGEGVMVQRPPQTFPNPQPLMTGSNQKKNPYLKFLEPAVETAKTLVKEPWGAGEAALNLATQTYGVPALGLAGVAGLPFGRSKEWSEAVGRATIYEPRTESGRQVTEAAAVPFDLLGKGAENVADVTREATGSPLLATGAGTAVMGLPLLLGNRGFRQATKRTAGQVSERGSVGTGKPGGKPIPDPKYSPTETTQNALADYQNAKVEFETKYGPDQTQWPGYPRNRLEVLRMVSEDAAQKEAAVPGVQTVTEPSGKATSVENPPSIPPIGQVPTSPPSKWWHLKDAEQLSTELANRLGVGKRLESPPVNPYLNKPPVLMSHTPKVEEMARKSEGAGKLIQPKKDLFTWIKENPIDPKTIGADVSELTGKESGISGITRKRGEGADVLRDKAEWEGIIPPGTTTEDFVNMIKDTVQTRKPGRQEKITEKWLLKREAEHHKIMEQEMIDLEKEVANGSEGFRKRRKAIEAITDQEAFSPASEKELHDFFGEKGEVKK